MQDFMVVASRVWTGLPSAEPAEAVLCSGGKIAWLGRAHEVSSHVGPQLRVLRFPGALVIPGLVDSHVHLFLVGRLLDHLDLRSCRSVQEILSLVDQCSARCPAGKWLVGFGWDDQFLEASSSLRADRLSEVSHGRPVLLRDRGGHAAWVNQEALREARIGPQTPDPPGGKILRLPDGSPQGLLVDTAIALVEAALPPPSAAELRGHWLRAQQRCLELGLTAVHEAWLSQSEVAVLEELEREGQLKLRVYGMLSSVEFLTNEVNRRIDSNRFFVLRSVKLFVDGALGSRGAWLSQPYSDDPTTVGLVLADVPEIERVALRCLARQWQLCCHAIGDEAVHRTLNAYEHAFAKVKPPVCPRFRIEHAQVVRPEDCPRFGQLGIIASVQPAHYWTDRSWAERRLGPERLRWAYRWKTFLEAGAVLVFGSDAPVAELAPCYGLWAATAESPEAEGAWSRAQRNAERLTLEEALRAYTTAPAYASFAETRRGLIRPGWDADLTILSHDLFSLPISELPHVQVLATLVGGELCWLTPQWAEQT
jgi:predicted amidohydrolase YtcJ